MVLRSSWKSRHKAGRRDPPPCRWTRPGVGLLLWLLCVVQLGSGSGSEGTTKTVVQKDAEFDVTYNDTTEGVRVSVDVLTEGLVESPFLFVVRQKQAVLSFQVPLVLRGLYQRKYPYPHVGRTLCQPPTRVASETQYFFVDVSTLSTLGTHYQLRISRVDRFTLQTDKKFSFTASPSQPQCPVYDLDNNVAFIGMYQTMTKKGAITVQKKDFPSNSFYVVVVVKTEDEACGGPLRFYPLRPDELIDAGNRTKVLDVVVSPAIKSEVYVMGMLLCLGIFLSFYLLTFLVACLDNRRSNKKRELLVNPPDISPAETGKTPASPYEYGSFADNGSTLSSEAVTDSATSTDNNYGYMGREPFKRRPILNHLHQIAIHIERSLDSIGRSRQESLSSVEEDDYDTLADVDSDKNIVRTKKFLYVSDLSRKDKRVLSKKYQIYFWNIATIAVFYALPVVQLVITYQTLVCSGFWVSHVHMRPHYNAKRHVTLFAFNNILSNIGYVLLGLLFLLIVLKRDIVHNRAMFRNDLNALECGIPKHFGLFYAMGTALMMEGLLNTSFMYMIAGLCMLKLYQKRHPDINASAYTAYACLAGVIFFSVLGVVFGRGNTVFWIVFSVIHIVATLLLSIQLYYMGRWRLGVCYTCQVLRPWKKKKRAKPHTTAVLRPWKKKKRAKPHTTARTYTILRMIPESVERPATQARRPVSKQGLDQKTPAESREHNRDCILLSFFDDHDVWHFLSSIALFGSFLVLLTMDDDLDAVQRDKIYAF
ncbi:hypothetical protein CRUP_026404 [Coryphaenoides rupestris]|nr:hypothetical protein CRUP_026404 [Coryphaenoides rupestris]